MKPLNIRLLMLLTVSAVTVFFAPVTSRLSSDTGTLNTNDPQIGSPVNVTPSTGPATGPSTTITASASFAAAAGGGTSQGIIPFLVPPAVTTT